MVLITSKIIGKNVNKKCVVLEILNNGRKIIYSQKRAIIHSMFTKCQTDFIFLGSGDFNV